MNALNIDTAASELPTTTAQDLMSSLETAFGAMTFRGHLAGKGENSLLFAMPEAEVWEVPRDDLVGAYEIDDLEGGPTLGRPVAFLVKNGAAIHVRRQATLIVGQDITQPDPEAGSIDAGCGQSPCTKGGRCCKKGWCCNPLGKCCGGGSSCCRSK